MSQSKKKKRKEDFAVEKVRSAASAAEDIVPELSKAPPAPPVRVAERVAEIEAARQSPPRSQAAARPEPARTVRLQLSLNILFLL